MFISLEETRRNVFVNTPLCVLKIMTETVLMCLFVNERKEIKTKPILPPRFQSVYYLFFNIKPKFKQRKSLFTLIHIYSLNSVNMIQLICLFFQVINTFNQYFSGVEHDLTGTINRNHLRNNKYNRLKFLNKNFFF